MKPKLRFKEFSDEYVLSDLGKYLIQYKKTTNSNNQYPVLTSSRSGIFFQEDYFNRQVASKDNTGYNIVPRNYFTYRHMSDDTIFSFNINTLCDYGIVSTLYPVFTTNTEMNSNYLKEYLNNSKRFSEYCLLQKQGGSRTYMYFDKLKKFVGCFPSIQEQTKVSNFLSLIDKKIDLQSKKIEDLKLFKKGLSNNIFNNLKDFEEYKLGDLCNITTGKLDANAMVENGKYRFYTCAKEYSFIDEYSFDTEALLISGNGAYVGYIHYYNGKFNAYQRTYVLDQFSQNIQFIKCYLDENLSRRIKSEKKEGNTPYIVLSTLSDMIIKVPSKENQKNISNIINYHQRKILLEENKLQKLQELKKGLMQKMFV